MADTDVFGLLSLLLAAAGAVYLVWARVLRPGAEKGAGHASVGEVDRAAETMPPILRPEAELSPKMLAKREALTKSGRPPPPSTPPPSSADKSEPPKSTTGAAKREPARSAPAKAKADAPEAAPAGAAPAKAKAEASKAEPSKGPAAPRTRGAQEKGAPATSAKVASSSASKAAASKAAPSKAAEPSSKAAKGDKAPAAKIALNDVTRIDVEDDDEVEPTKVGPVVMENAIQPVVATIAFDGDAETQAGDSPVPLLVVYALAQTDTGRRRKQNEDSLLVLEGQAVFVVADGMGGHRGGQYASKLAVKTIGEAFERKVFDAAPHKNIPLEASELARAMQMANSAIFHEAKRRAELTGMGTTLCAARFTKDKRRLYLGHVGDSRCYRVRDGVMKQMTNDHTMAEYGVAGPEGAHLSRALGVWPTVPIDIIMAAPKLGDLYLLCSDGLTKMVPDGTIATQLLHEEDPKAAVERLVFFANAAGGKDNITVILLRVVEPGWKPPSAT